jgi:HD-GYP domain-containing protein (c-di-GMP phosphodiesterase class II)
MSTPLEVYARQSHFIVKEGASTRKLTLPSPWTTTLVSTEIELLASIQQRYGKGRRQIVLLSEEEFQGTVAFLRNMVPKDALARIAVVVVSRDPEAFLGARHDSPELLDVIPEKDLKKTLLFHLLRVVRHLVRAEERGSQRVSQKTLEKLNDIFIALSAERDPQKLLATILLKAIDLANAQGGTLYMTQETDGEIYFRLKISTDRENEVTVKPLQVKVVENSLSGYVSLTGKLLNVPELSELRPLSLPQFNRNFDHLGTGKTASVLTVPLKNGRNEIIAILQLVDKKSETNSLDGEKIPGSGAFDREDESLLSSFVTQAAICLENVDLYADIQRLFEGFVKASITAIESRDPSTGGHSERVARICVALARATTECEVGIYRSVKFKDEEIRELEYAALLHDFGKIGVREEVLVKAKKLYTWQLDSIKERIKVCKAAAKIEYLERRIKQASPEMLGEKEYLQRVQDIEGYWSIILAANEPTVLKKENMESLERVRNEQLLLPDGSHIALLTEDEYRALSVTQGSLTENERLEIESHVRHTYQFLKMIPWTKDFKHLPEIAYAHHEKLDGTGYPRGLTSHEIPLQSKIMTIADIFDALTAADRWYKEAVTTEKAIEILAHEVHQGKLDPVLYELFVEKRIFDVTQSKIIHQVA